MEKFTRLIEDLREAKATVRMIENDLGSAVFELPKEVLDAVSNGIVKFNFSVPSYVYKELRGNTRK